LSWAERNGEALGAELEPGERLLAAHRVMITSATSTAEGAEPTGDPELDPGVGRTPRGERLRRRAARGKGSARMRLAVARELGLPVPGSIFILGLSDRRLLFWKASVWLARPGPVASALPLDEVAAVTVVRRLWMVRAAVVFTAGPLLIVQPLWDRHLRDLESSFRQLRE
jgi:hypothetical protein